MAEVILHPAELANLPPTCVVCGVAASVYYRKRLHAVPWWFYLVLWPGLAWCPLLIFLKLVPHAHRSVHMPLCVRHRNHWRRRDALLYGAAAWWVSIIVMLVWGSFVVDLERGTSLLTDAALFLAVVTLAFLPTIVLIAHVLLKYTSVYARTIRPDGTVVLAGAAAEFAEALRIERAQKTEAIVTTSEERS